METRVKKKSLRNRKKTILISAAAAALIILLTVILIFATRSKAVTRVSLDVTTGYELILDKKQKVIEVNAVSPEGCVVTEGLDEPEGQLIYPILEAIIGKLSGESDASASPAEMLITVVDANEERAGLLKKYIKADLEKFFETNQLSFTLLLQTVNWEDGLFTDAEARGITVGKAALLEKILEKNSLLDADKLLSLPLGDLYALSEVDNPELPIGRDAALEAAAAYALGDASVLPEQLNAEIAFNPEKTPAVYTVTLDLSSLVEGRTTDTYTVNAYTGEVLSGRAADTEAEADPVDIGADAIRTAVLQKAGLSETQVTDLTVEKDIEDGDNSDPGDDYEVYEVSFVKDKVKYEYTLLASDGSVLNYKSEPVETAVETEKNSETEKESEKTSQEASDIGLSAAEAAALKHAGFSSGQVSSLSTKRDTEKGKVVYEVEFKKDNTEYEYTVDASTGKIIKYETETVTGDIGLDAAQAVALKHAGFSESEVSELSVLKTTSDGKTVYKVVFTMDNEKNTLVVSASDGKILSYDTETLPPRETETESQSESEPQTEPETEENPS